MKEYLHIPFQCATTKDTEISIKISATLEAEFSISCRKNLSAVLNSNSYYTCLDEAALFLLYQAGFLFTNSPLSKCSEAFKYSYIFRGSC